MVNNHDVMTYLRRLLYAAILLLLANVSALADGSSQKATTEEQAFHRRMQSVFAAALPAEPPAGWEITERTEEDDLEVVAEGVESGILGVEYSLEWKNLKLRQQKDEAAAARIGEVVQEKPVSDAQLHGYEQLAAKISEAAVAGDLATVQKLQQELERKSALINEAYSRMDQKFNEIQREEEAVDSYARIHLSANKLFHNLEEEAERITVAGYPAFRTKGYHSSSNGWIEASTTVFLGGKWFTPAGTSTFQFANEENAPHTKLQSIVVRIEADPARTDTIVEKINWASLQREIGH